MKLISEEKARGKNIFLHCDFNVNFEYTEKMRISYGTIEFLLKHSAKLTIGTHYKRPSTKKITEEFSIEPIRRILEKEFSLELRRVLPGDKIRGRFNMLENLRCLELKREYFEEFFDLVIFDAFPAIHRDWPDLNVKNLYCGFGFLREYEMAMEIKQVDCIILGGAKRDKLKIIDDFNGSVILCGKIADYASKNKKNVVICPSKNNDIEISCIKLIEEILIEKKRIFWNGPPGKYEEEKSANGTISLIKLLMKYDETKDIFVGGNDTLSAIHKFGYDFKNKSFSGGALLEFLCKKSMKNINKFL